MEAWIISGMKAVNMKVHWVGMILSHIHTARWRCLTRGTWLLLGARLSMTPCRSLSCLWPYPLPRVCMCAKKRKVRRKRGVQSKGATFMTAQCAGRVSSFKKQSKKRILCLWVLCVCMEVSNEKRLWSIRFRWFYVVADLFFFFFCNG